MTQAGAYPDLGVSQEQTEATSGAPPPPMRFRIVTFKQFLGIAAGQRLYDA